MLHLAEAGSQTFLVDLSAYPRWLVVLGGTVVAALAIWIVMKLLKWALWLLFFAVIAVGVVSSVWLLFNR